MVPFLVSEQSGAQHTNRDATHPCILVVYHCIEHLKARRPAFLGGGEAYAAAAHPQLVRQPEIPRARPEADVQ